MVLFLTPFSPFCGSTEETESEKSNFFREKKEEVVNKFAPSSKLTDFEAKFVPTTQLTMILRPTYSHITTYYPTNISTYVSLYKTM